MKDASRAWPETEGPDVAVARVVLPPQDACSDARQAYMDDIMPFRPAHSLQACRPLGSLMRARLRTCSSLSAFRHRGRAEHEPASLDGIPD